MKNEAGPIGLQKFFEDAISSGKAAENSYLNLIALYFRMLDHGYATTHKIPRDVLAIASSRGLELCRIGTKKFGDSDGYFSLYEQLIPYYGWDEPISVHGLKSEFPWSIVRVLADPSEGNLRNLKNTLKPYSSCNDGELFFITALHEAQAICSDPLLSDSS